MENINNKPKIIITIMLILLLVMLSHSTSYAYWATSVSGDNDTTTGTVTLGSWTLGPVGIDAYSDTTTYTTYDIVWYDATIYQYKGTSTTGNIPSTANNWTILNELVWYSTVTYYSGDVVLYNGVVYVANATTTGSIPSNGGAWTNMSPTGVYKVGQTTVQDQQFYYNGTIYIYKGASTTTVPGSTASWQVKGNLTYSASYSYSVGDIALYNGNYYQANNTLASGQTPGASTYWTLLTVEVWSSKIKNGTNHVTYNGLFYAAAAGTNYGTLKGTEPGTAAAFGVWSALDTQIYQQYNTYAVGDLVMYNSTPYRLVTLANSTVLPGTATNSWNNIGSMTYNAFNTYSLNQYVVYNGFVYQAVNVTNANATASEVVQDAWNRLSGYDWYSFNNYSANQIVFHSNAVYKALLASTNIEPGVSGSEAYWGLYNQN